MNLIRDAWLPVIRASGKMDRIAPWQVAEKGDPVKDFASPRPDFQGALYQFLIGLLQTCFPPADHDEWCEYWEAPPDSEALRDKFNTVAHAFGLECGSEFPPPPAFLQDPCLDAEERKGIAALLIEAPGDKTVRDNLDHFIKRGNVKAACLSCTATALFTLQTNAPAGGRGHRVGLRGGGPLTTLVLPDYETALWHRLWLNVLDTENFTRGIDKPDPYVFPWVGQVRISDITGADTRPEDGHPLQVYWGMPRRVKLIVPTDEYGVCDLCGTPDTKVVRDYVTRRYGVNYEGEWIHPLSPYRFDPKKEKPPISAKGQEGGIGYRHWVALVLAHSEKDNCAAKIVRIYMAERSRALGSQRFARLWCFGYDMDNMKARCWYDQTLPLFSLNDGQRENLFHWANDMINAASDVSDILRGQIKVAWFRQPGDAKGDTRFIAAAFWQRSESTFYDLLGMLAALPGDQRLAPPEIFDAWAKKILDLAYALFDEWVMAGPAEDLDMKRIVSARLGLKNRMHSSKSMKGLFAKGSTGKEAANATGTTLPLS